MIPEVYRFFNSFLLRRRNESDMLITMEDTPILNKKPEDCNYSFFCHKTCEYFPCHKTDDLDNFNCLFCYCPLYALGERCGGNFSYTKTGIKDCSACTLPHIRKNYSYIMKRFTEIAELAKKRD